MNFPEDPSALSAAGVNLVGESEQPSKTIPSLQVKKLLVPTDFFENSEKALMYAVRVAQRNNSSPILFHVFELPEFVRQLPEHYSEFNEETRKQFDREVRRSTERLETLSVAVKGSDIKIETSQQLGTPHEEIVKVAKEGEVDLIVIATHGYTGLKHFLLGSTAERVVRLAPCPLLVVRAEERDFVSQK